MREDDKEVNYQTDRHDDNNLQDFTLKNQSIVDKQEFHNFMK